MLSQGIYSIVLLIFSNIFMTQEVITLAVFTIFSMIAFKMELKWNHLAAFFCLILAVYFVFKK